MAGQVVACICRAPAPCLLQPLPQAAALQVQAVLLLAVAVAVLQLQPLLRATLSTLLWTGLCTARRYYNPPRNQLRAWRTTWRTVTVNRLSAVSPWSARRSARTHTTTTHANAIMSHGDFFWATTPVDMLLLR